MNRTPLTRRTPLRRVSAKRRAANQRRRAAMVAEFGDSPLCVFPGCGRFADDVHEPGMRSRGADPTDPQQGVPICRHHHERVHANPAEATRLGLLIPSWVADKTGGAA